jgi:SAM-dependent methyltransferase
MGDINQFILVRRFAEQLDGPYLEIGSKNYGSTQDLRSIFGQKGKYVGVDMEEGPGVDLLLDLTGDFGEIDSKLHNMRFGTIFCLSVLEHCSNPFRAADNLTRLLKPGGKICLSAPFSWEFHGYPSDYWRFTHEGIRQLFPELEFNFNQGVAATSREGEFRKLDEDIGRIRFSSKSHMKHGHFLRGISAKLLKMLGRIGIWRQQLSL